MLSIGDRSAWCRRSPPPAAGPPSAYRDRTSTSLAGSSSRYLVVLAAFAGGFTELGDASSRFRYEDPRHDHLSGQSQ